MIKGFIKANNEGFKNTDKQKGIENVILSVKSDRPTKFKKRQIAFYDTNFKNPAPTSFSPQSIKEDTVYGPKEFNAKISYTEDPFKELFGYTKRINPDDHLNPKYYEFKLGNKNENSYIIENLQAENGTATNDVEQRLALKDFLELRKLQEEEDEYYERELEPLGDFADKKMMKRAFDKFKDKAGIPATVTTRSRRGRGGRRRGGIVVENAIEPPDIPPPPVDKFKEFEHKTDIGDFEFKDGKTPTGEIPPLAHMQMLVNSAADYLTNRSNDRSAIIKINKYLKKAGIEPLTSKELREGDAQIKLNALIVKMYGAPASPPRRSPARSASGSSLATRSPFRSGSSPPKYAFGSSSSTRTAAGGGARGSPRSMIKDFVRSSEEEQARKDYFDRLEKERSEIEEELSRTDRRVKEKEKETKDTGKSLGAAIISNKLGGELTKKVKSRFDQWKGKTDEARRKAEMDEKFAAEEEANAQKFAGARRAVDIKEKANIKSLKAAFEKLKNHSPSKYDKPVDVETTVNPVDAPKGDTKRIRESLGEPGTPENKKVLRDVVSILGPILHSAKIAGNRKIPPYYVPYMNALYKANEDLQKQNGKSWRSTSTLARLEEALDYVERILDGRPEPEKRPVGRPTAKPAAAVAPVGGWEL